MARKAKSSARAKGKAQGGTEPGQHIMEVDLTLDELAEILAEELKLPRIEPKGKHRITTVRDKYSGIRRVGPESLRHFKRILQGSAETADHDRRLRSRYPDHHPAEERHPLSQLEGSQKPAVQRGHHFHDGRLRLDGRRAEGTGAAWKVSGSTPGCGKITKASKAATSSTMSPPRKWTSRRSITCAKTAAPKSAAPSAAPRRCSMPITAR